MLEQSISSFSGVLWEGCRLRFSEVLYGAEASRCSLKNSLVWVPKPSFLNGDQREIEFTVWALVTMG